MNKIEQEIKQEIEPLSQSDAQLCALLLQQCEEVDGLTLFCHSPKTFIIPRF